MENTWSGRGRNGQEGRKILSLLEEKGISPTFQRTEVLGYLLNSRDHPDAEEIYRALEGQGLISKATVYNTLKLFAEKGLVTTVAIDRERLRFDAVTAPHGHFRCGGCSRIFDFPVLSVDLPEESLPGFLISEREVYFKGLCPDCQANATHREDESEDG